MLLSAKAKPLEAGRMRMLGPVGWHSSTFATVTYFDVSFLLKALLFARAIHSGHS